MLDIYVETTMVYDIGYELLYDYCDWMEMRMVLYLFVSKPISWAVILILYYVVHIPVYIWRIGSLWCMSWCMDWYEEFVVIIAVALEI